MAISRMQIPRQLRAGGGIMTLEEPRQGFFLGKIVKKAKRAVKKVVKSPLGKAALLGAAAYGLGGAKFLGGQGIFSGGQGLSRFANLKNLFLPAASNPLGKRGLLAGLAFDDKGQFSLGRAALSGLGATALAAPFLMGGDEEEEEPETPFTQTPDSIASIVNMARNQDPSLRFLPKPKFVDNFYAADGGLASIDTPKRGMVDGPGSYAGINRGNFLMDEGDMKNRRPPSKFDFMKQTGPISESDIKFLENLSEEDLEELKKIKGPFFMEFLEDILKIPYVMRGGDADMFADGGLATMRENFEEGKLALGEGFKSKELNDMALEMFGKNLKLLSRDELEQLRDEYDIKKGRVEAAEGGLMDLGGFEKDYREGGFVPLGAEERADDVPARLSKNEFVFTADAVRNAGQGDIDKGAEVMQNMMDNLEAGGTKIRQKILPNS